MILGVMFSSGLFVKKADAVSPTNPQSIFESLKATNSLKKIDPSSPNETIIG